MRKSNQDNFLIFRTETISAKLGHAMDASMVLSRRNYISGAYKVMVIISADGTSRSFNFPRINADETFQTKLELKRFIIE